MSSAIFSCPSAQASAKWVAGLFVIAVVSEMMPTVRPSGLEVFKGAHGVVEGGAVEGAEALVDEEALGLRGVGDPRRRRDEPSGDM